jgi:segregation and condensation protein B
LSSAGIKNIIESLIFASDEEITLKEIKDLLDTFKISVSVKEVEESINELNSDYENGGTAFEIIKIAGGYQFATRKKFAHFLGKLTAETQKKKLSQSAIETLSIIAYKQPITRTEIEFVRGVNVDYIVNSLLERDLITIKGRADGPGRPILYGTTANFLKVLGLNTLEDLPKLKEINEILKNEKIDGITEADIDLFNSMSLTTEAAPGTKNEQPKLFDENNELIVTEVTEEISGEETETISEEIDENENNLDEFEITDEDEAEQEEIIDEEAEETTEPTDDIPDEELKKNEERNDGDGKKE